MTVVPNPPSPYGHLGTPATDAWRDGYKAAVEHYDPIVHDLWEQVQFLNEQLERLARPTETWR